MLDWQRSALLRVVPNSMEAREGGDGTQRRRRPERGKIYGPGTGEMEPTGRRGLEFHGELKMDDQ